MSRFRLFYECQMLRQALRNLDILEEAAMKKGAAAKYRGRGAKVEKKATPLTFDEHDINFLKLVYGTIMDQKKESGRKARLLIEGGKILMAKYALLGDKSTITAKPEESVEDPRNKTLGWITKKTPENENGIVKASFKFPGIGRGVKIEINDVPVNVAQMREKIKKAGFTIDEVLGIPFDTWRRKVPVDKSADLATSRYPFAGIDPIDIHKHRSVESKDASLYQAQDGTTFEELYDTIVKEAGMSVMKHAKMTGDYMGDGRWENIRRTSRTPSGIGPADFEDMISMAIEKLRNSIGAEEDKSKLKDPSYRRGKMKFEILKYLSNFSKEDRGVGNVEDQQDSVKNIKDRGSINLNHPDYDPEEEDEEDEDYLDDEGKIDWKKIFTSQSKEEKDKQDKIDRDFLASLGKGPIDSEKINKYTKKARKHRDIEDPGAFISNKDYASYGARNYEPGEEEPDYEPDPDPYHLGATPSEIKKRLRWKDQKSVLGTTDRFIRGESKKYSFKAYLQEKLSETDAIYDCKSHPDSQWQGAPESMHDGKYCSKKKKKR